MWDRERGGARRRELHSRKARRQSDGHLCNRQPIVVGDVVRASTLETVPASGIIKTYVVFLLGNIAKSSSFSHQVESRKGSRLLALGCLCPTFD